MPLNGLFVALAYIGLGYAISKYKHKLKNRIFYCVLYAISIAFYYIFYKSAERFVKDSVSRQE